ncbi:MAG: hypothetical protein ACOYJB_08255 [Christensenellaceae bacterium]|jgi:hypothetical protein
MMFSDFFALSVCAISLLYVPFMVICQMRFGHILQSSGFDNRRYFGWIKNHFVMTYLPLAGIFLISILGEAMLRAYLSNTMQYEMGLFYGYLAWLLVLAAVITIIFWKYTRIIKIEDEKTPLVCSKRLVSVFLLSCLILCVFTVLTNLFTKIDVLLMVLPLLAPLLTPLSNVLLPGREEAIKTE